MYVNNTAASISGGLASGIPGELRGLEQLHRSLGTLPWKRLVQPAIHVARHGFPITEDTVKYMGAATNGNYDFLTREPAWAVDFAPNGTRKGLGEILTRKRYADTLEAIAEGGAEAFYSGAIANATVAALKRQGGIMTLEDLRGYSVALREPLTIDYNGYKITSCAAPSGGPVTLAALKIFETFAAQEKTVGVNLTTHRLDESMRFAYAMRTKLGDPSFARNITAYERQMISQAAAEEARGKISDVKAFDVAYYDPQGLESLETVSRYAGIRNMQRIGLMTRSLGPRTS
jgi:gamma-glutamyltranspeptidase/glutathione hydrolase